MKSQPIVNTASHPAECGSWVKAHYAVDEKTTVTKLPQPDARQQEILKALGVSLPAI